MIPYLIYTGICGYVVKSEIVNTIVLFKPKQKSASKHKYWK